MYSTLQLQIKDIKMNGGVPLENVQINGCGTTLILNRVLIDFTEIIGHFSMTVSLLHLYFGNECTL